MTQPVLPAIDALVAACAGLTKWAETGTTVYSPDVALASSAAEQCVVFYDMRRDMDRAIAFQVACIEARRSVLFVGVEPGLVQIGPQVRPGASGCLHCWQKRRDNNHRSERYSAIFAERDGGESQEPLMPSARSLVHALLRQATQDGPQAQELVKNSSYLRVKTSSLEVSQHRFLAVTACPHCPPQPSQAANQRFPQPRPKRAASDKRVPNPCLTLAAARHHLVDRYSGLVKHIFQNHTSDLMPLYTAEMALPGRDATESGYGRAESIEHSELIAILEAVERYAGQQPRGTQESMRGNFSDLAAAYPGAVTDPASFILHTDEQRKKPQFALIDYAPTLPFQWCWAQSMRHGRAALIPEQLAYYDQRGRHAQPVNRFVYDSSNGCSLGGCLEEAVLGGLYELVERDAYFTTWYTRIAPTSILTESITDSRSAALIARAHAEGIDVFLFDVTTDVGIPVVWAMAVDPAANAPVKSYCASGCHGRWDEAVFSALVEVTTSMGVYRRSLGGGRARALQMLQDSELVQTMPDHVLLYSLPESYERLSFLHGGPCVTLQQCEARIASIFIIDISDELRTHSDRVLNVAADLLFVDQTFGALAPLGLHCAKVVAPGLLPVTFGHQYQRISYERLNQVARFKGVDTVFTAANINPFPHNFP